MRRLALALVLIAPLALSAVRQARSFAAEPSPEFGRDVVPILENNCLRCHNTGKSEGGLLLESYEDMMRGGDSGVAIVPGKPDDSPLLLQVEGRAKPKMPPKADLDPADIAVLRAWIAAGAASSPVRRLPLDERVPPLTQRAAMTPQVTSVAWRPDGGELGVAGYKEVRRFRMPGSERQEPLGGLSDLVRSIAWSPDGSLIAAGGGTPGVFGELVLFEAQSGSPRLVLDGHRDYVYHVAFSADGSRLASCGYDRVIRIWDTARGKRVAALREHTEAVYAVAFSSDGKRLASASADRSVKIWNTETSTRVYTVTDPTDAVMTLAFRPGTSQLAAAGADRRIRVWDVGPDAARPVRNMPAHQASVLRLAYSADGRMLASSGADRVVKLWDADTGRELRALGRQSDWVQALAFSPDGQTLAVGRHDGSVTVYDTASGGVVAQPLGGSARTTRMARQ